MNFRLSHFGTQLGSGLASRSCRSLWWFKNTYGPDQEDQDILADAKFSLFSV